MKSKAIKIRSIISTAIVAVSVVLAVLFVGVRLFGLRPLAVLSGSMEPEYPVGSLTYIKRVDYKTLKPGDVITFMLDENTLATHRIVEVISDENDPSELRYRTRGDANSACDGSLVHRKNIVGTPVFSVPKLGYVANFIQTPPGSYAAISAAVFLLVLAFIPEPLAKIKRQKAV